jgi:hypothetical protein
MANAYQNAILTESSLIHYWELDESSGTTAADSKGSLAGTISGSSPPTLGQPGIPAGGTCYLFSGTTTNDSSYISASSFSTGGTGLSIECWVYLSASLTRAQFVAGWWQNPSTYAGDLYLSASGQPTWYIYDGTSHTITGTVLSTGIWHHLVAVAPGSGGGTIQLYIDGMTQTGISTPGASYNVANSIPFWIGGGVTGGISVYDATFRIDEVAVYNAVLTPSQVTNHYNTGITSPATPSYSSSGVLRPTALRAIDLCSFRD